MDAEDGGGSGVDGAKRIGKVTVRRWFRIHGMAHRSLWSVLRLFWMNPDQPWFGISVIFNLTLSLFNFTSTFLYGVFHRVATVVLLRRLSVAGTALVFLYTESKLTWILDPLWSWNLCVVGHTGFSSILRNSNSRNCLRPFYLRAFNVSKNLRDGENLPL